MSQEQVEDQGNLEDAGMSQEHVEDVSHEHLDDLMEDLSQHAQREAFAHACGEPSAQITTSPTLSRVSRLTLLLDVLHVPHRCAVWRSSHRARDQAPSPYSRSDPPFQTSAPRWYHGLDTRES